MWVRVGHAFPAGSRESPRKQHMVAPLPQEHKAQRGNAKAESCLIASNGPLEIEVGHQREGKLCGAGHRVGGKQEGVEK